MQVPIAWQEAVAVASLAEHRAAALGVALDIERCLISTSGALRLAGGSQVPTAGLTALRLLAVLLEGQKSPKPLRDLIDSADDALSAFPSEQDPSPEPRYELSSFVSPEPHQEIARLAERSVAYAQSDAGRERPLTREVLGSRRHTEIVHRNPRVTMRVERLSRGAAAGIAAAMLLAASGIAAVVLVGGPALHSATERSRALKERPASAGLRTRQTQTAVQPSPDRAVQDALTPTAEQETGDDDGVAEAGPSRN